MRPPEEEEKGEGEEEEEGRTTRFADWGAGGIGRELKDCWGVGLEGWGAGLEGWGAGLEGREAWEGREPWGLCEILQVSKLLKHSNKKKYMKKIISNIKFF